MRGELSVRAAERADLPALAHSYLRTRGAAYPAMPRGVHSEDEVVHHLSSWDLTRREVWVAEVDGVLAGHAVLVDDWLDGLYVEPAAQGDGVGSALLDLAKARRPDGFCLWVFESNTPAREFYLRRGLVELERTDGSGNEERSPDVRMAWPGGDPLGFFRRLIDEVDEQLGDLLARRAALTRVVQEHKPDARRDPVREAEIASALAARAPALGEERVARILDAIITASLEAAADPTDR